MEFKNIDLVIDFRNKLHENISKVILGKPNVIDRVILSAFCNGYLLIEDVPGKGKTIAIE